MLEVLEQQSLWLQVVSECVLLLALPASIDFVLALMPMDLWDEARRRLLEVNKSSALGFLC